MDVLLLISVIDVSYNVVRLQLLLIADIEGNKSMGGGIYIDVG